MKPKHKRLVVVLVGLVSIFTGVFILLDTFRDNLIYFYPPKDIASLQSSEPQRFEKLLRKEVRVGGMVKPGTYIKTGELGHKFTVTDYTADLNIEYTGLLPPMFREGQGIVAQGGLVLSEGRHSLEKGNPRNKNGEQGELNETKYQVPGTQYYFIAKTLITKHDEKYMPPEVERSLKKD